MLVEMTESWLDEDAIRPSHIGNGKLTVNSPPRHVSSDSACPELE